MTNNKRKIVIAITGASGSIYAQLLLEKLIKLKDQVAEAGFIMSDNAKAVWQIELQDTSYQDPIFSQKDSGFRFYNKNDFNAPFASGSALYSVMIICPCSMGTLGRIASGISDDLITRTADVMLKERRKLILVTREMPFSLIHINNIKAITEAGGIVCPASPSFYSNPSGIRELAATVINRVLDLAEFKNEGFRWNEK